MHPGLIAAKTPNKPAYIMAKTGQTVTYGELEASSNQYAHYFRSLGLKIGDHVAIFMENNAHFLKLCWGAHRAGLYYTCMSTHLQEEEISYILHDCEAKVFITSMAKADMAAAISAQAKDIEHRLMVDGVVGDYHDLDEAVADMPTTPIADETEGSDMLYSSGTTGQPKGIKPELSGEPFGTPGKGMAVITGLYRFTEDSIYLSPAPLYHAAPLRFNMAALRLGGTSVIMDRFDPEGALALIEQYGATHSQWVPTMFVRFFKLPQEAREKYDVSSMQVAIHAAAPCPIEIKRRMIEWWGPVIMEYYAGTEGNGLVAINSKDWLEHEGSVGRALVSTLHIVGSEGEDLPPGEEGTIYFEGDNVFEYHNDPEKTADSRNRKGWTTLGDVGYVDKDGFLYLTDRKSYMIISGGVNIYPQEVEDQLLTHPAVMDAAVIGIPSDDFGESVHAVVQLVDPKRASDDLAAELIEYCRAHISHIKCPRAVDFEPELPRLENGKLYKRLLRDRYWKGHATRLL